MAYPINKIVVHCSATQNGRSLRTKTQTAAERIDDWHKKRGFQRAAKSVKLFNPHLKHVGYHFIIDTDGTVETGRQVGETGAHVKGHNLHSIGICLAGGITIDGKNFGRYTERQWRALQSLLCALESQYPDARICGHRDLSPDLNGDGKITRNEWLKDCPCFEVQEWLDSGQIVNVAHLFKE